MSRVLVLMAIHNGEDFLEEQLSSIYGNRFYDIEIELLVCFDNCTDRSVEIVDKYRKLLNISSFHKTFGSSFKSFSFLFEMSSKFDADYISFADQDDIWRAEKLSAAIHCLNYNVADCYASSVITFSDSGANYQNKCGASHFFDHVFQGPGPGMSMLIKKKVVEDIVNMFEDKDVKIFEIETINFFDHYFYFISRLLNHRWFIDENCYVFYRQHANNIIGYDNRLLPRLLKRGKMVLNGHLTEQPQNFILSVKSVIELDSSLQKLLDFLNKPKFSHLVFLVSHAFSYRRQKKGSLIVLLILVSFCIGTKFQQATKGFKYD